MDILTETVTFLLFIRKFLYDLRSVAKDCHRIVVDCFRNVSTIANGYLTQGILGMVSL